MANITIIDAIGRLVYRLITPFRKEKQNTRFSRFVHSLNSSRISEISIYIGMAILLLSLLFPVFKQPFFLLVTSASLSAFTMWVYPPLLLRLNFSLPKAARPGFARSVLVFLAAFFYGAITLWALSTYIPLWTVIFLGVTIMVYHLTILFSLVRRKI